MKAMPWVLGVLGLVLITGCSYVKQPNDKKMTKLVTAMPEYNANETFGKRDFRFVVARDGDEVTTPQVPACLVTRFGTKEMANTDYAPGSYDYEKYAAVAKVYARYFNAALLELLASRGWDQCEATIPESAGA